MKKCMDKIYYPILPIYDKMRGEDKRKEQLIKDAKGLAELANMNKSHSLNH